MDTFFGFFREVNLGVIFIKLFGVVLGLLYLFFSVIMIRQIDSLKMTVGVHDQGLLKSAAYVQIILSIIIVLFAIFLI